MLTDEQLINELRSALNRAAAAVTPPPDVLKRAHAGLADPAPSPRWPMLRRGGVVTAMSVAATVAVVVLALVLVHPGHPASTRRGGYRPPYVSTAQVSATVSARVIRAERFCLPINASSIDQALPCEARVSKHYTVLVPHGRALLIRLTFTARLAATNVHSIYEWSFRERATSPRCAGAGSANEANTMTPIRAGQRVVLEAFVGACPGHYSGLVTYQPNAPSPITLHPGLPIRDGSVLVGRFSFTVR